MGATTSHCPFCKSNLWTLLDLEPSLCWIPPRTYIALLPLRDCTIPMLFTLLDSNGNSLYAIASAINWVQLWRPTNKGFPCNLVTSVSLLSSGSRMLNNTSCIKSLRLSRSCFNQDKAASSMISSDSASRSLLDNSHFNLSNSSPKNSSSSVTKLKLSTMWRVAFSHSVTKPWTSAKRRMPKQLAGVICFVIKSQQISHTLSIWNREAASNKHCTVSTDINRLPL